MNFARSLAVAGAATAATIVATAGPASAAASVYKDEGCETFGAFEFCCDVKSVLHITETPSGKYNLIDNGKFSYTYSENGSAARSTAVDLGSSVSPGADLKPTNIKFDRSAVVAGRSVLLDSGVRNLGDQGTGVFNIKWFVHGEEVAYGSHGGVPGKAQVLDGNTQIDYTFANPGNYSVTFVVDADNHVAESNEDNNWSTVTVKVTGVDLRPTNIKIDRSAVVAGRSVLLDSGVRNLGEQGTDGFTIKWFVHGEELVHEEVAYGRHGGVPGKAQVLDGNSQIDYTFANPGSYSVIFVVDVGNHVPESNENNNSRTVKVKVKGSGVSG